VRLQSNSESGYSSADLNRLSTQISNRPSENNNTNVSSLGATWFGIVRRQPEVEEWLKFVGIERPRSAARPRGSNTVGGVSATCGPSTISYLIELTSSFSRASSSDNNRNRPGWSIRSQTFKAFSLRSHGMCLQCRAGTAMRPPSNFTKLGPNVASSTASHKIMNGIAVFSNRYIDITRQFPYDIQQNGSKMFCTLSVVDRWTSSAMCVKLSGREPSPRDVNGLPVLEKWR
jgi:hypothetical protein